MSTFICIILYSIFPTSYSLDVSIPYIGTTNGTLSFKLSIGTISNQDLEMLTFPLEKATTGKCLKPLQTLDVDAKLQANPIEQADQKD